MAAGPLRGGPRAACPRPSNEPARSASATSRPDCSTRRGRSGSAGASSATRLDLHGQALSVAQRDGDVGGTGAGAPRSVRDATSSQGRSETVWNTAWWPIALFRELGQRSDDRPQRLHDRLAARDHRTSGGGDGAGRRPRSRRRTRSASVAGGGVRPVRPQRSCTCRPAGWTPRSADGERGTLMLRRPRAGRAASWSVRTCQNEAAAESWSLERDARSTPRTRSELARAARRHVPAVDRRSRTLPGPLLVDGHGRRGGGACGPRRAFARRRVPRHRAWAGRVEVLIREWAGDPEALDELADRIERVVLPTSAYWGIWGPYARALSAFHRGRHEDAARHARTTLRDGDRRSRSRLFDGALRGSPGGARARGARRAGRGASPTARRAQPSSERCADGDGDRSGRGSSAGPTSPPEGAAL